MREKKREKCFIMFSSCVVMPVVLTVNGGLMTVKVDVRVQLSENMMVTVTVVHWISWRKLDGAYVVPTVDGNSMTVRVDVRVQLSENMAVMVMIVHWISQWNALASKLRLITVSLPPNCATLLLQPCRL